MVRLHDELVRNVDQSRARNETVEVFFFLGRVFHIGT